MLPKMKAVPSHIEAMISKKHDHEGPGHPPLWLIWKLEAPGRVTAIVDYPSLYSVCDSPDEARFHVQMLLETNTEGRQVWVDRVPANHGFASSLADILATVDSKRRTLELQKFRNG